MADTEAHPPSASAAQPNVMPRTRLSTFLAACRQCSARPDSVIGLHPYAAEIRREQPRTAALTVTALLVRELEDLGGQLVVDRRGTRTSRPLRTLAGLDYYRSRRGLAIAAPIAAIGAELPALWRRLLGLDAASLTAVSQRLGESLVGTALHALPGPESASLLARLAPVARAALLALRPGAEPILADPTADRLRAGTAIRPEETCQEVGLAVLAGLAARLHEHQRRSLQTFSVTNVPKVLAATAPMPLTDDQAAAAARLLNATLPPTEEAAS